MPSRSPSPLRGHEEQEEDDDDDEDYEDEEEGFGDAREEAQGMSKPAETTEKTATAD